MSSSATSGLDARAAVEHEVAALDLGHDLDVVLEREQARERAADHRLVLGDEDADHALASGTVSRSRKPPLRPRAGLERRRGGARARSRRPVEAAAVAPRPDGSAAPSSSTCERARVAVGCDADRAVPRAAVADDVRRALAHRPGEHGVDVGRAARSAVPSTSQSMPAAASAARAPSSASASASRR